jgi:hypothetical protein
MTRKVYKSAMGKEVDLGALLLQNENVRAVGNMNVNARGDVLDSANRIIDQKNRQVQRQYKKQTNVSGDTPVHSGTREAKQSQLEPDDLIIDDIDLDQSLDQVVTEPTPVDESVATGGGLAAAIARSRTIKQEKEKTLRERQQSQGPRKI